MDIFLNYEKKLCDRWLLILDQAASHISKESIKHINDKNIEYELISMEWHQFVNHWTNKNFKNSYLIFKWIEKNIFKDINPKIKLKPTLLNLFYKYNMK